MNSLRKFRSHCKGSVALLFAIAVVPVVVGTGLAVDYARALGRRTLLQNRLDGAVTALARETATLTDDQIRTKIMSRLEAAGQSEAGFTLKTVSVSRTTPANALPQLTATASGTVETSLMKIVGIKEVSIEVTTRATWDTADVVLVLENSGTMSSGSRMTVLRTAVNNFITRVGANDNLVQIGLVPYAVGVRVPVTTTYTNADWILFTGDNADDTPATGGGEEEESEDSEDSEDGSGGGTGGGGTFTPIDKSTWTGCLTDRKKDFDTDDTNYKGLVPAGDPNKKYPAIQTCRTGETNLSTIIPLTSGKSNFNSMITHVNGMVAGGGTNMTIGVAWGHAMLSKAIIPFPEARAPAPNHRRIIILVSAHTNTKSRWFDAAASGGLTSLDTRTRTSCTAAKAAGIEIYTLSMSYSSSNDSVLSECASPGPGHFVDAASGADVEEAFNDFADTIRGPRLTH